MEESIQKAEARVAELEAELSLPTLYATQGDKVPSLVSELESMRREVDRLYARWQELETLRAGR